MDKSYPLTKEHLARLNKVLQACQETSAFCDKCQRCGIDVGREAKVNAEQEAVARAIKAEFFPNDK